MTMASPNAVIKVFLVNGETRSVRLDERTEVVDIIYFILEKLRANLDVSPQLFALLLRHIPSHEEHWLTPGYSVLDLIKSHCGSRPINEWRFYLRLRVLPKTPQHLFTQDPTTFAYYYDQVLHMYLDDDSITVDNDTALKLGCLEIRRFFRDMTHMALKKKENYTMLEKEYGFEKFFKKSFLQSVKKKNLRQLITTTFQQYDSLTADGCIFQFFAQLSHLQSLDVDRFHNCAIGDDATVPLTTTILVGPNCDIETLSDDGDTHQRRFLMAFKDINAIMCEPDLMTRGRLVIELKANAPITIRTAQLQTAVHMSSLIDGYCMVYTSLPDSRLIETPQQSMPNDGFSHSEPNHIPSQTVRLPLPLPPSNLPPPPRHESYSSIASGYTSVAIGSEFDDYAEVRDPDKLIRSLGRPLSPRDIMLSDKIGEGQFGDVHKGVLYPDTTEEALVAIKTCKPGSSPEERAKFLQEAAVMRQFSHPHIIKLFGVVTQGVSTYIVMELAPLGQLRQYLLLEGQAIPRSVLLEYIRQLCSAMVHLEARNYVHRDIAARNILVVNPEKIKLSDFGLSRWLEEQDYYVASRGKLPIKWMAPESINFRRFTGAGDVWMWGVCCWEVLMRGIKPFVGIKNDEVIGKIEMGERLPLPPDCPAPLFALMNQCWQYDPSERPTFREVEQQLSLILDEEHQLQSISAHRSNMRRTPEFPPNDLSNAPLPPLPPRSHPISPPLPSSSPDPPPISKPRPQRRRQEESIEPYSVTNIPGAGPSSPTGSNASLQFDDIRPSFSPIPPPPILRPQRQASPNHSPPRPTSASHYYTLPTEDSGIPTSQSHQALRYAREPSPYETSYTMSPTHEPAHEEEEEEEEKPVVEDSETLECTTAVVKAVMELSNKLPLAKPNEYVDLVKNVGLSLRQLLVKVDDILNDLPDSTHHEVRMAHKVLSSDMSRLVERMKELQKNCHSFLADDYQKQLLQAATIVAVNSRHLLDAVNNARSKATPSHGRRS